MSKGGRYPKPWQEVLTYRSSGPKRMRGLRKAYLKYRQDHNVPYRCDKEGCMFNDPNSSNFEAEKPIWRGMQLPLIVDHVNGQPRDNSPHNLRLLCPCCAFQLGTHGGHNRGRVRSEDQWGYVLRDKNGRLLITYFPSGGVAVGGTASVDVIHVNDT